MKIYEKARMHVHSYHNLLTIMSNTIKSLPLQQNVMGFLQKWDTTFRTEQKYIWCNLHSHG